MVGVLGNKPFTQQPERFISQADQSVDQELVRRGQWRCLVNLRMREEQALLAQDYAWNKLRKGL